MQDEKLVKTIRMNMLFDFYSELLTDRQQTFLKYYYDDDYSLGEIAALFEISRQAVYEHIKRAEHALEDYESKLLLLSKHEQRKTHFDRLRVLAGKLPESERDECCTIIEQIEQLD